VRCSGVGFGHGTWGRFRADDPATSSGASPHCGREYGVYKDGGLHFSTDACAVAIGDLHLRLGERFTYEYDLGDGWMHDLRIEATLPVDPRLSYPFCTAGRRAAPPEDCGGPQAFMADRSVYALFGERQARELREDLIDEMDEEEWDILSRYHPDRFDRRAVNQRPGALASQPYWRSDDETHD
jgi:hypothetical protein